MARSGGVRKSRGLYSPRPELLTAPSPLALSLSLPMTLPLFLSSATNSTTTPATPLHWAFGPHCSPFPTAFFSHPALPAEGAPRAGRWGSALAHAGRAGGRWRGLPLGMRERSDRAHSAAPPGGRAASVRSAPALRPRSAGGAAQSTCVGRGGRSERVAVFAHTTQAGAPRDTGAKTHQSR